MISCKRYGCFILSTFHTEQLYSFAIRVYDIICVRRIQNFKQVVRLWGKVDVCLQSVSKTVC